MKMLPVSVFQDSGRLKQNLQLYLVEILSSKQSARLCFLFCYMPSSGYLLVRLNSFLELELGNILLYVCSVH